MAYLISLILSIAQAGSSSLIECELALTQMPPGAIRYVAEATTYDDIRSLLEAVANRPRARIAPMGRLRKGLFTPDLTADAARLFEKFRGDIWQYVDKPDRRSVDGPWQFDSRWVRFGRRAFGGIAARILGRHPVASGALAYGQILSWRETRLGDEAPRPLLRLELILHGDLSLLSDADQDRLSRFESAPSVRLLALPAP